MNPTNATNDFGPVYEFLTRRAQPPVTASAAAPSTIAPTESSPTSQVQVDPAIRRKALQDARIKKAGMTDTKDAGVLAENKVLQNYQSQNAPAGGVSGFFNSLADQNWSNVVQPRWKINNAAGGVQGFLEGFSSAVKGRRAENDKYGLANAKIQASSAGANARLEESRMRSGMYDPNVDADAADANARMKLTPKPRAPLSPGAQAADDYKAAHGGMSPKAPKEYKPMSPGQAAEDAWKAQHPGESKARSTTGTEAQDKVTARTEATRVHSDYQKTLKEMGVFESPDGRLYKMSKNIGDPVNALGPIQSIPVDASDEDIKKIETHNALVSQAMGAQIARNKKVKEIKSSGSGATLKTTQAAQTMPQATPYEAGSGQATNPPGSENAPPAPPPPKPLPPPPGTKLAGKDGILRERQADGTWLPVQ